MEHGAAGCHSMWLVAAAPRSTEGAHTRRYIAAWALLLFNFVVWCVVCGYKITFNTHAHMPTSTHTSTPAPWLHLQDQFISHMHSLKKGESCQELYLYALVISFEGTAIATMGDGLGCKRVAGTCGNCGGPRLCLIACGFLSVPTVLPHTSHLTPYTIHQLLE